MTEHIFLPFAHVKINSSNICTLYSSCVDSGKNPRFFSLLSCPAPNMSTFARFFFMTITHTTQLTRSLSIFLPVGLDVLNPNPHGLWTKRAF
jgi:hypothetical protein